MTILFSNASVYVTYDNPVFQYLRFFYAYSQFRIGELYVFISSIIKKGKHSLTVFFKIEENCESLPNIITFLNGSHAS